MDVRDIIEAAGGVSRVATALGVKHPSVCGWKRIPVERVRAVSALTGIPPHEIRPDIFDAPTGEAAA